MRATRLPADWPDDFLRHLAEHGDRARAAGEAGVAPKTVANRATRDPAFRASLDAAQERGKSAPIEVREEWVERFLTALRTSGSIRLACRLAHTTRDVVWATRRRDPVFRERVQLAQDDANDQLEATARFRAMGGSDQLLMFLLKAAMPEKYGDTLRIGRLLEREEQNVYDEAIAGGHAHEVAMSAVEHWRKMIGAGPDA